MPIIQIYSEIPSKAESFSNLIENIRDLGSKALSCEPSNLFMDSSSLISALKVRETKFAMGPHAFAHAIPFELQFAEV